MTARVEYISLGEMLRREGGSIRTGPFGTTLRASEYSDIGVPVVSVGEIGYGSFQVHRDTRRVGADVLSRLPAYRLNVGDIVFARKGAVDRCATVRESEDGWFLGSDGIRLRLSRSNGLIDPVYLGYALQTAGTRRWLLRNATGTTMATLNQDLLESVPVWIPEKEEQGRIASILDDASDMIDLLQRLIAKSRDVKQSMMQELLAGRTRLPGFAAEWREVKLGEMARPAWARVDPKTVSGRVIELEDIASGGGKILGDSDVSGSLSLKTRFEAGDVLFGKLRPYLRKYWLADRGGYCSTEVWALRSVSSGLVSSYLRYVVEQDDFIERASVAHGTHMPRADWNVVATYDLRLPSVKEQEAIAGVLLDADAEIEALDRRLESARAVKAGMMQELLTGRTRLPAKEDA
ncbi:MAG: hypothetical protein DI613_17945 [Kocuria rhizophila]|nr:MAG: hypothetical protein DI613_17945 [Kocuria rhizophila]PZT91556.1 MAG: hypothetical protein DI630_29405 [Gordonia sp. (in: high G+C Gram-positive bacteria)]